MKKTLYIFDFDDTLVFSGAVVYVNHQDGSVEELSSHEFAEYKPQMGDRFDYREFDTYPPSGKIISKTFSKLLEVIRIRGEENVTILSARSEIEPMLRFLCDHGLHANIEFVGVGSSSPLAKANFIDRKLQTGNWNSIEVFEDSLTNLETIESMINDKHPLVQYTKHHIRPNYIFKKLNIILRRLKSISKKLFKMISFNNIY